MRAISRIVCLFAGHRWRVLRSNRLVLAHLGHLHPYVGCDTDCARCGARWRDFEHFNRYPWTHAEAQP